MLSECHKVLQNPVISRRSLMLAACEDSIHHQGNMSRLFMAVSTFGRFGASGFLVPFSSDIFVDLEPLAAAASQSYLSRMDTSAYRPGLDDQLSDSSGNGRLPSQQAVCSAFATET